MSWEANRIYTKPTPELIDYLKTIDGFKDELFLVDNLEGIRFDWTRSFMLSDEPNENSYRKHTLPEGGLLVIKPEVYKIGYDKDYDTNEFWNKYKEYPNDKWGFIDSVSSIKMNLNLDLTENQLKLLSFIKSLNEKFSVPFLYYYCVMWGGDIEEEYAIVFNEGIKVYHYDYESKKDLEITNDGKTELNSTVLQTSFKYLDLELPTWFFALHEGSFDWKKYHLKENKISI
ncbi:hypothetical protein [Marinigracilibium pacificum]|uniref:Uncharacterized protein n=1 Tax=Marinigracilibium pacificum TaxID=2729599 RepID=A0A848J387_9BACT|nr:hypothetical protein [Marinigracilibium pacificum]NMM47642.1 hypothetical protein [Marinigracilibium pacificum]